LRCPSKISIYNFIFQGAGIDPTINRRDQPKEFAITPDNLDASTLKSVPKFKFEG